MSYVFLDVAIGNEPSNRLIIELFEKEAPEACRYFKSLVNHPQGYTRSHFHRVIEDFMIQGGDVDLDALAPSIDETPRKLENEDYSMDKAGSVGLAMTSPAEINPQFFITLVPAEHLKGHHTIFGRIVKGMEMVEKISHLEVDDDDKPIKENEVVIVGCGELQRRKSQAQETPGPPTSNRTRETNGRSRDRSVSARGDSERRKRGSESPERRHREHKRRRSHDDDNRDGEHRQRGHHHHRHDDRRHHRSPIREIERERSTEGRSDRPSQTPRHHESRQDRTRQDRTRDDSDRNIPTGPRGYRPQPRYRLTDNYGRLGYVDEDEDYRDDEDRLREAESLRDAERGHGEPEVRYKGRGAMKYRERY